MLLGVGEDEVNRLQDLKVSVIGLAHDCVAQVALGTILVGATDVVGIGVESLNDSQLGALPWSDHWVLAVQVKDCVLLVAQLGACAVGGFTHLSDWHKAVHDVKELLVGHRDRSQSLNLSHDVVGHGVNHADGITH